MPQRYIISKVSIATLKMNNGININNAATINLCVGWRIYACTMLHVFYSYCSTIRSISRQHFKWLVFVLTTSNDIIIYSYTDKINNNANQPIVISQYTNKIESAVKFVSNHERNFRIVRIIVRNKFLSPFCSMSRFNPGLITVGCGSVYRLA